MRREVKAGEPIRKQLSTTVKADGDRTFTFTASTAARDRENDTIAVEGWDLGPFKRDPVILWSHDHNLPAIGQARRTWAEDGALNVRVRFANEGTYALADVVHDLVDQRVLRAVSVGFVPKEFKLRDDADGFGVDFLRQELLEVSVVNIPANPEALVQLAKRHGVSTKRLELDLALNLRPRRRAPPAELVYEVDDGEPPVVRHGPACHVPPDQLAGAYEEGWADGYAEAAEEELRQRRDRRRRERPEVTLELERPRPRQQVVMLTPDRLQAIKTGVASGLKQVVAGLVQERINHIRGRLD